MRLRNRILLITSGVLIFLALAPTAIFFARGFRYDFTKHRVLKTGTLVIKTDPREVRVSLNGEKLKSHAPLSKRFLLPGEYAVELSKEGYRPWKKRVAVNEQKVTYLPSSQAKRVALFLETPIKTTLSTTTSDNPWPQADDTGSDLYYVSTTTRTLMIRSQTGADEILIPETLPDFSTSQIIATPNRQIFLLLDQTLYQVTNTLKKLSDAVNYAAWNQEIQGLLHGNDHEVWLYFPDREKSELLTRSSQNLGTAQYNHATGYLFVAEDQAIKAIEYDSLGQPNVYTFAQTQTASPKFIVNPEGTTLTYLDGQDLISLQIR